MPQPDQHDAAAKLFPCTLLLLGDHADTAVEEFCRDSSANIRADGISDTQRLLTHLQAVIARAPDVPGYAEDVAAYEGAIAALAATDAAGDEAPRMVERDAAESARPIEELGRQVPVVGRHVRVERYRFNAPGIVAAIEECDRLEGREQPADCIVLLVKRPGNPRPDTFLVSEGVQMLLALCDGQRDCAAIAQRLQEGVTGERAGDFERRAFEAIEALRARTVLTCREPLELHEASDEQQDAISQ